MNIPYISQPEDGHDHTALYEASLRQVSRMHTILDFSLVMIQFVDGESHDDPIPIVVAVNPFIPSQTQVICMLPTETFRQMELLKGEDMEERYREMMAEAPQEVEEAMSALRAKAIVRAMDRDEKFGALIANDLPPFEVACERYIEHYKLREGGDFNLPVE